MSALEFSAETALAHAPLVQRAAGIFAAIGLSSPVRIGSAGEGCAITLGRSDQPALERQGAITTLAYDEPDSEAALAALIACATRPEP